MARGRELSQLGSLINIEDSTQSIGVATATPSQKVGIGTNSPTSKVEVVGNVLVSGIITATSFVGDGSGLSGLSTFSGSYNDLSNTPTIPSDTGDLTNSVGFVTSSIVVGYATEGYVDNLVAISTFSGDYNDLSNQPSIPSIVGLASEGYVDVAVANLVDSAPSTLDTLNELAAALGDDANFSTTITNSLANKANLSGANFTGVVTATSYYGDGSNLSNIISGVGINSNGVIVGTGITTLNFVGSSVTTNSGIATITITGGGGGGGAQVSVGTEAPVSPSQGDLWYNTDLARTFVYYNDGDSNQWVDSSPFTLDKSEIVKEEFTISGSQSTFYLSDTYTNGYIDVYVNGSKLASSDFVETASNIITLTQSADDGDIVGFVNYKALTTNTRNNTQIIKEVFPVTSTQSLFTLTEEYTQGYVDVYVNGVKLTGLDFTQTSSNSITLTSAAESDDVVEVVNYKAISASTGSSSVTATGVPDWRDFSLF